MKRRYLNNDLLIIARLLHIDTGDAFKPITDDYIAERVRAIPWKEKTAEDRAREAAKIRALLN